jgi:hypothetical protein
LLVSFAVGIFYVYSLLSNICKEQTIITDQELDVVIETGKMVSPDVIVWQFGLTNGAVIADIPFAELRKSFLDRIPNVQDIKIEIKKPNRVIVEVFEREPIARIVSSKKDAPIGRVVDADGMVFRMLDSESVKMLPIIREGGEVSAIGKKLSGMTVAAMHLVRTALENEFSTFRITEIKADKTDYLYLSFADASHAKFAWKKMGEDSKESYNSLKMQMQRLRSMMATKVNSPNTIWIMTDWNTPGRGYANNPAFTH